MIKFQSGKLSTYIPLLTVAVLAIAIGLLVQQAGSNKPAAIPEFEHVILLPNARAISEFSLLDENGDAFTNESLTGQWNLLFFGFTNCPDVCPTTMLALKEVRQRLESKQQWPDLNVIMVSVDPERDTAERLKPYVSYFHPQFKGLTGDLNTITEFAKELGILFFKTEKDKDGYYDVDHSVSMILVNPQGHYAGVITAPHEVASLESDLSLLGEYLDIVSADITEPMDHSEPHDVLSADSGDAASLAMDIDISNAWVRAAPPNSPSLSAYLDIENNSTGTLTIQGVSSPLFDTAMIHETVITDGIASMQHANHLSVAADAQTSFAPMGQHIMLMGAIRELKLNDQVPITLKTNMGNISFMALVLEQSPK